MNSDPSHSLPPQFPRPIQPRLQAPQGTLFMSDYHGFQKAPSMKISRLVQAWFYGGTTFGMLSVVGVFATMAMKPTKSKRATMTEDGMVIAVTKVPEDADQKASPLAALWARPGNKGAALETKNTKPAAQSVQLDRATEAWFDEAGRK